MAFINSFKVKRLIFMLTYPKDSNGNTIPGDSFNKLILEPKPWPHCYSTSVCVSPQFKTCSDRNLPAIASNFKEIQREQREKQWAGKRQEDEKKRVRRTREKMAIKAPSLFVKSYISFFLSGLQKFVITNMQVSL